MNRVSVIAGRQDRGRITTDCPDADLMREVMSGQLVVIKGAFASREARRLRDLAFAWSRIQSPSTQLEFYSRTRENHFCIQRGVSKIQKTLHYYSSYNFNRPDQVDNVELRELLAMFCRALATFYNDLTGNGANFGGEHCLHPQIIHYPSGGGFFAKHSHAVEPQRVGLITSLSQRGEDFDHGGTGFEIDGEIVEIEPHHDAGDVALFRYDLPHWVSPIDIERAIDSASSSGRWTLVLPYY